MRILFQNLYIFVFALVSILLVLWAANNPHKTLRYVRPLVEDAVELKELAQGVYRQVSRLSLEAASDEAISLFVATIRMPTMLLERVSEKLDAVDQELERRERAATGAGVNPRQTRNAGFQEEHFEARRRPKPEARSPWI